MPSAPAIRLELRRSRWPTALLIGALVAGSATLLLTAWSLWLRLLVLIIWLSLAAALWWRRGRQPTVVAVAWRADGSWWLESTGAAKPTAMELAGFRIVGPLLALQLRVSAGERQRVELSLWPDSADPDGLRRLRMRLMRSGGVGSAPSG